MRRAATHIAARYAAAIHSLSAALIAVSVGLALGTTIGVTAGSVGGAVEDILMRIVDVLLAIPTLLLSLSVIILLGFGTTQAAVAVGAASVDRLGRKPLLLTGSAGMTVALGVAAYAFGHATVVGDQASLSFAWGAVALAAASSFVLFFALTA